MSHAWREAARRASRSTGRRSSRYAEGSRGGARANKDVSECSALRIARMHPPAGAQINVRRGLSVSLPRSCPRLRGLVAQGRVAARGLGASLEPPSFHSHLLEDFDLVPTHIGISYPSNSADGRIYSKALQLLLGGGNPAHGAPSVCTAHSLLTSFLPAPYASFSNSFVTYLHASFSSLVSTQQERPQCSTSCGSARW